MRWKLLVRIAISAGIFLAAFMYLRGDLRLDVLDRLEHIAYDLRLRASLSGTTDERIVIIDIDERSISAEGHWPWPRARMAELVDRLFEDYAVLTLSFDMAFAEAERGPDRALLDALAAEAEQGDDALAGRLEDIREAFDGDRQFARSLQERPVILGYVFRQSVHEGEPATIGALPPPGLPGAVAETAVRFPGAVGYTGNIEVLQRSASNGGFFNQPVESQDPDGVFRRVALLQAYDGDVYTSLALETVRTALGAERVALRFHDGAPDPPGNLDLESIVVGDLEIPVDEWLSAAVPFRGGPFTFDYVSAADVLDGSAPIEKLFGRVALVGTSAPGLLDLRSTPVATAFAGVEIHANLISGMLDGDIRSRPPWIVGYVLLLLIVVTVVLTWILVRWTPLPATLASTGVLLGVVALDQMMWRSGLVVPVAMPILLVVTMFVMHMTWGFFVEQRTKRELSRKFGQYVPPELVAEMERNPTAISMEGENREMSVLFSDIRGFTTLSEELDPRELSKLMNEYLTEMTRIIHDHRGTIDKYMGDAIMAFWGAPLPERDHARSAVDAGLAMLETCNRLSWRFVSRGWPQIKIGVGISTGHMSVGNMGSEFRTAYTVLGDVVNLGSRLEGLTKNYGVLMIVSETTRDSVPGLVWRELDIVRVKGKSEPVAIFEPLGPEESVSREKHEELDILAEALAAYRSADWDEAQRLFIGLDRHAPGDELYRLYLDRIEYFRRNPPAVDWDGVFSHTTK